MGNSIVCGLLTDVVVVVGCCGVGCCCCCLGTGAGFGGLGGAVAMIGSEVLAAVSLLLDLDTDDDLDPRYSGSSL